MGLKPFYITAAIITVAMVITGYTFWRRRESDPLAHRPMGYSAWAAVFLTMLLGNKLGRVVEPHWLLSLLILGATTVAAPFLLPPWSEIIAALSVLGLYVILGYHVWMWAALEFGWSK